MTAAAFDSSNCRLQSSSHVQLPQAIYFLFQVICATTINLRYKSGMVLIYHAFQSLHISRNAHVLQKITRIYRTVMLKYHLLYKNHPSPVGAVLL